MKKDDDESNTDSENELNNDILQTLQQNHEILETSQKLQMNLLLGTIISDLWDLCKLNRRSAFVKRTFHTTWVYAKLNQNFI